MTNSPAQDFLFYASVQQSICNYSKAVEYLKQFIAIKPDLDKRERNQFGTIFKDAIDQDRNSLRALRTSEQDLNNGTLCDLLKNQISDTFKHLKTYCDDGISLIDKSLLEHANDPASKAYFLKMKGDLYRYIYEYTNEENKEELLQKAQTAYKSAIQISTEQLNCQDPVRLGTLLNYAVFLYEHMKNYDEAITILRDALHMAEDEKEKLSNNSSNESITIIQVIQANLANWSNDYDTEEEEIPN